MFPWLASVACRYQEYEITGMLVEMKTLCADFSATLNLGSVFLAADYNVLSSAPTNKRELENMEYASSVKPSSSLIMPIECEPKFDAQTHLYIAQNSQYNSGDQRLYDMANVFVGSEGLPTLAAGTKIAELWITYEVLLYKPIIRELYMDTNIFIINVTNATAASPFIGASRAEYFDSADLPFVATATTITFPRDAGNWRLTYISRWTAGIAGDAPGLSTSGDIALGAGLPGAGAGFTAAAYEMNTLNVGFSYSVLLSVSGNPTGGIPTVTADATGVFAAANVSQIRIERQPNVLYL